MNQVSLTPSSNLQSDYTAIYMYVKTYMHVCEVVVAPRCNLQPCICTVDYILNPPLALTQQSLPVF